jgi:hypothetical protein
MRHPIIIVKPCGTRRQRRGAEAEEAEGQSPVSLHIHTFDQRTGFM